MHRLVAGPVAEQSRHADVIGVVVLDPLLAAQRMPDRGLEALGQGQDLVVRAGDTTAAEQGDPPGLIDQANELVQHLIGWSRGGPLVQPVGVLQPGAAGLIVGHVPGEGDDPHPAAPERLLDRDLGDPWQLLGTGDELAVVAALLERQGGVGLLEVAGADLGARDLGGQRQHRRHAAMGVVEAVDQVQVPGPAAARAGHQPTGQLRLGTSRERAGLLVSHVHPIDAVVAADSIHNRIEAIAHHPVHAPHPGREQDLDELVGDGALGHDNLHSLRA